MIKLNLGCGRAQLPTTRQHPMTRHLQMLPESAFDPDARWKNVDRADIDGVDEVVDLFAYPWVRSSNGSPWNDNSVEEIWCSHLVEHIPHQARYTPAASKIHRRQGGLDGWYAFFYEAWRVLAPGGLLHIVTPFAWSLAAIADPSHTRLIAPGSFGYLSSDVKADAPFDYQAAAKFEQVGDVMQRPTEQWLQRVKEMGDSGAALDEAGDIYMNVFDELYICLEAVKDAD